MTYVDPSLLPDLPLPFMNRDHAEEFRLLEELGAALEAHGHGNGTAGEILERLAILAVQTREHFLHEESVMREAGFPAYLPHKAEHDRVLAEMDVEAQGVPARAGTRAAAPVPDRRRAALVRGAHDLDGRRGRAVRRRAPASR